MGRALIQTAVLQLKRAAASPGFPPGDLAEADNLHNRDPQCPTLPALTQEGGRG